MRSRLTVTFAAMALLVIGTFVAIRTISIGDLAEDDLRDQVKREALVLATVLDRARAPGGDALDPADLGPFAQPDRHVRVVAPGVPAVEASGPGWSEADAADAVTGATTIGGITVVVRAPGDIVEATVSRAVPSLLVTGAALVLLAAVIGALVATAVARPFTVLAGAAEAMARGRSDLRLPRSRVPEARAIADALDRASGEHGDSLRRERDLALRASHELRTPLTSLRMVLHELTDRDDAPADLVEAADLAARHVDRLDRAVDSVLEETRSHPVLPGAQLPLGLVVPALAQRWADTLALAGVPLEAELLGDDTTLITPGPVEQVLDEVLQAVLAHRGRSVRLVVGEAERHLRVTVTLTAATVATPGTAVGHLESARAVVDTVGGRMSGDLTSEQGLVVVLPRR